MPSTDVTLSTRNGETFDGYLTQPEGDGPFPGIVLITAIFGTDEEMREIADAFAADGFVVSVPDIFWRVLPGPTADMEVAFDRYGKFDTAQGVLDVEDIMNDLRGRPECNGRIGVLGFCFGGLYAHLAAARLGADAAAAYHGTRIGEFADEASKVTCPVSFHFGADDPIAPMDEVKAIAAAYADNPRAEIVTHPDCGHNFAMPHKQGYQEAACVASRAAALRAFQSM